MRRIFPWIVTLSFLLACTDYAPKPRGYMRIEPGNPHYTQITLEDLPYQFNVSQLATVELPPIGSPEGWINIAYPSLNARIYCSYMPITPEKLPEVEKETLSLVTKQVKAEGVLQRGYENREEEVYCSLFILDGDAVSPIQFMLTDSTSRFFRGALYYEMRPNIDSLAPVTRYIQDDIIELVQSFRWKK